MAEVKQVSKQPIPAPVIPPKEPARNLIVRSRFIKTPPDKLRFVAKAVLQKEINSAITYLSFSKLAASKSLRHVLRAGLSQAKDKNVENDLYIKGIAVDEGPKLKRRRIVQQGRATAILKRMSHITIILSDQPKLKKQFKKTKKDLLERPKGARNGK